MSTHIGLDSIIREYKGMLNDSIRQYISFDDYLRDNYIPIYDGSCNFKGFRKGSYTQHIEENRHEH